MSLNFSKFIERCNWFYKYDTQQVSRGATGCTYFCPSFWVSLGKCMTSKSEMSDLLWPTHMAGRWHTLFCCLCCLKLPDSSVPLNHFWVCNTANVKSMDEFVAKAISPGALHRSAQWLHPSATPAGPRHSSICSCSPDKPLCQILHSHCPDIFN